MGGVGLWPRHPYPIPPKPVSHSYLPLPLCGYLPEMLGLPLTSERWGLRLVVALLLVPWSQMDLFPEVEAGFRCLPSAFFFGLTAAWCRPIV